MGEHLLCKQEVVGSIPIASTKTSLVGSVVGQTTPPERNTVSPVACATGRLFDIVNRSWISVGLRAPVRKGDGRLWEFQSV